ncbi:MAG: Ig-like domain-containing protein, partial [Oscillospiraceae bacterium]|nr:Ig-like domain-containing protein [Oscillospiraceae bacterium]
ESFGNRELQLEGNTSYYLLFRVVGNDERLTSTGGMQTVFKSFKLAPPEVEPVDELSSFSLSSSSGTVLVGETVALTATAMYSLSGTKILTEGVTYKSSDENIAAVSPDGVVTGIKEGNVTITATVDGTEISDTVDIAVKEIKRATKEYVYSFDRAALGSSGNVQRTTLNTVAFDDVVASLSAPWRPAGTAYVYNTYANASGLMWNAYESRADQRIAAYAIELKVAESGMYIPSLSYLAKTYAPIVDVYLVERTDASPEFVFGESGNGSGNLPTYIGELGDEYKLATIDMYSAEAETKTDAFDERYLDSDNTYYLLFRAVGKNESFAPLVSGTRQFLEVTASSFKIKPPAGEFDKIGLSVHGLLGEDDPMPNMTEKQLEYKLYDDVGILLDDINESELTVEYSSSEETVAVISDTGIISAKSCGNAVITANITYNGISRSEEYKLLVAPAGRNMMADLNPDFENDEWVWDSVRQDEAPEEPVFFRSGIETEPKDGDEDNRALAFNFDPSVPMPTNIATIFLKRNGERVEVEPGKFYQLTFKVKTNITKPEDGEYPTMRYGMYAYNSPTGTSSSALAFVAGRETDINKIENWEEAYSEWQECVVPLAAPSEYDGEILYLSPRLNIRAPATSVGKAGYSGTIWMDDFELREVGYAGIEMEISGDPSADGSGTFTVLTKPYTTLGHYISIGSECLPGAIELSSSDEYVVADFQDSTRTEISGAMFAASTVAETGGKNGTAEISAVMTLNGISRSGKTSVTTSGYDMKLLYASAVAEPASVEVGGASQVIPTGFMSDGSAADMTGGRIIYESLTPEIVSVDENGKVTTHRAGKGKLAATLVLGGSSAYTEVEITVTDSSPIVSASLSAPETVGYLRDEALTLTGKMQSGYDADFTNADINWIIESDPVGGVSIDENNMIFGEIEGAKATVKAEITMGGATVTTNEIAVTVVESDLRDFVINFGGVAEKEISDVTIEKYGWELDTVNSHSSVLGSYLYNRYIYVLTNGVDRDFVVDFEVPYTGNYMPVFLSGESNGYGSEKSYIYIDGVYVGEYRFYEENIAPRDLRTVHLEAGVHKLTLRPAVTKTVSRNYYQYPRLVRFAAVTSLPGVKEIITEKSEYEIAEGNSKALSAGIVMTDGFVYEWQRMRNNDTDPYAAVTYTSSDLNVASVDENGNITAVAVGDAFITVKVMLNGVETTKEVPVHVVAAGTVTEDEMLAAVEIEAPFFVMNPEAAGVQLTVSGKNSEGKALDMTSAEVVWAIEDTSVAGISESGYVTPAGLGSTKVTATVTASGITKTAESYISVREGKVGRTYYTDEMVAAARENITKYSWAKSESKSVIANADKYLGLEDKLWEMVPGEGIPRANTVGFRSDPDRYTCRFCGIDLLQNHGSYSWISNPLQRPWKIQCPDCKRVFPSNDFASFYELGRDEHGIFSRELALERHQEMFGGTYGTGYLKNTLYPEVGTASSKVKLTGNETPEKWGVDDGYGYDTGRVYSNGTKEIHTYIAYYNHYGLWHNSGSNNAGTISNAINTLAEAYMFTGDERYGRVGAILLDRVADVYPGYDLRPYLLDYSNSDGGTRAGKIIGKIWEVNIVRTLSKGYDAFFPMYDDPQVISFLSEKAKKYNNTEINDKSTPEKIRKNIEDGALRESFREVQRASIHGNFGAHQSAIAQAAIVLDTQPDTGKMIDWLFAYSETDHATYNTGGEINKRLVNDVSRDGQGNESAPGYNRIWVTQTTEVASVLAKYDEYEGANLYENPKFVGMIKSYAPLTLVRRGLAPIGDSGTAAFYSLLPDNDDVMINAFKETKDVEIAQHLYFLKGGNLDNLHYDIYTRNPESLSDEIEAIIEEHGEYNYDRSSLLSGYGFGVLRDGTLHKSEGSGVVKDMQHDFWMYFGGAASHGHSDKLNLGIEAYGLPMTTDLGYPETASKDPNRNQWQGITLSHNTVVVNEDSQATGSFTGVPLHFDTKDTRVKVMDVDASMVYAEADEYRRTIVMVDFDDEISYGIDFFKVLGGNDHLYSFHATSEEDPETSDNLTFKAQATGSYAGAAVPYGEDPWSVSGNSSVVLKYPVGYTWLDDVKRADNPGTGEFYVDWKIKDFWNQSRNGKQDIRLRMTMVNDWKADEVSLLNGMPPRTDTNLAAIDHLEYMLVRRKGRDLNTLFTTVIEPYNGSRYIKSIENVPVTVVEGTPGKNDVAKAVKVELIDGRVDYIVYAQNNTVTYSVGDIFEFRGFVGVWSIDENGVNIYSYVNDGEMIGNDTVRVENLDAVIKGTITDFQDELSFDNWIEAELDVALTQEAADDLSGRIINVEREALGNSTYVIESVDVLDGNRARINLGNVTLISGFVDAKNEELGYKYDVAVGKSFDIPLSYEDNPAPVFDEVADNITTSAGSSVSVTVSATGDDGATVTYRARTLPRGASFDAETGTFTWKPTASQIGDNLVAVDAVDEYGRISTKYFTIT